MRALSEPETIPITPLGFVRALVDAALEDPGCERKAMLFYVVSKGKPLNVSFVGFRSGSRCLVLEVAKTNHAVGLPAAPERGPLFSTPFHVEFDFVDDDPNANTADFRDLLLEKFEQAALEGRMSNVIVTIDHARLQSANAGKPQPVSKPEKSANTKAN